MTIDGFTMYTTGDRFKLWRCSMCGNGAEWQGTGNEVPVCNHCGAEDLPHRKPQDNGVYTIDRIGNDSEGWRVVR